MTILFAGAEAEDFTAFGTAVQSQSGTWRSAYARTTLTCGGAYNTAYFKAGFTAQSQVSVTAQFYINSGIAAGTVFLWLGTSGSTRLRLKASSTAPSTIVLESYTSGGVATTLATSTLTIATGVQYKLDLIINYASSGGSVKLYLNQALFIDFSGDPTASGSTSLNELYLGAHHSTVSFITGWSEVIVATGEDTRPLSLKTIVPNATGDTTGWTSGTWAEIDDNAASDSDLAVSDTANQVLAVNCTGMPAGASGLSVRALKSVALAARGSSGPSKIALGLRQSSTNAFATGVTLDTGYGAVSQTWTTNPVTSAAFTGTEIENIQLAYRSET